MKFDYSKEVDRGVALLNSIYPGWQGKIDLQKFNMSLPSTCILGQLYGYYYDVKILYPKEYGFVCDHNIPYSYKDLTEEWISRLVKTFDLSKDKVEPGEYTILKKLYSSMGSGCESGDTVKVIEFIPPYTAENEKVINMVIIQDMLFSNCPLLVTPLKKD